VLAGRGELQRACTRRGDGHRGRGPRGPPARPPRRGGRELERIAERCGSEVGAGAETLDDRSARRSSASSSGWRAAARQLGPSTRSPSASTPRRSSTSSSSRSSAPDLEARWPSSRADPRHGPQDHAAFEETFEATPAELRGAGRAPLPGRPRPPAPRHDARPRLCWGASPKTEQR
jgi:hypothetical protein